MKVANLTDVKNDLSRYVDQVRRGERVRILVRGLPVADIVPAGTGSEELEGDLEEAELTELERRGVLHRGPGGVPAELRRPGPRVKGGDAVRVLLDERRRAR
ncbi:MAG: type II toxin-antitoxin system prevent-host-death family antitoxin [Deltaproteobacteria bacterium]|nr:type II toxin-antitoxin system prevent-host-death family antitoxin [Deltaproteobacteria bacterium]